MIDEERNEEDAGRPEEEPTDDAEEANPAHEDGPVDQEEHPAESETPDDEPADTDSEESGADGDAEAREETISDEAEAPAEAPVEESTEELDDDVEASVAAEQEADAPEADPSAGDGPAEAGTDGDSEDAGEPAGAADSADEIDEPDSAVQQPDAPDVDPEELPRTPDGSVAPDVELQEPVESEQPQSFASPETPELTPAEDADLEAAGLAAAPPSDARPLLVFLNEVAGGRKLLQAVRDRLGSVSYVAVVAPQNQPAVGALIDDDELRDAARSRVDVTLAVFEDFGIEAVGEVMDADPFLALDDAVRAHDPNEVLISCLPGTRFGLLRKDLVQWAHSHIEPEVTHIPVRIADDAVAWDVTHTLVVATQTIDSPDLVNRLKEMAAEAPHRFTIISPRSGTLSREEVSAKLAKTLAELYRQDVDATGQPMSPDPFHAVQNAIANYRIDEVLISTLAGEQSQWLEEDLVGRVREITDKPVQHIEAGRPAEVLAAAVADPGSAVGAGSED